MYILLILGVFKVHVVCTGKAVIESLHTYRHSVVKLQYMRHLMRPDHWYTVCYN